MEKILCSCVSLEMSDECQVILRLKKKKNEWNITAKKLNGRSSFFYHILTRFAMMAVHGHHYNCLILLQVLLCILYNTQRHKLILVGIYRQGLQINLVDLFIHVPGNKELQDLKMERCTYIYNVSLRILHEYVCKST